MASLRSQEDATYCAGREYLTGAEEAAGVQHEHRRRVRIGSLDTKVGWTDIKAFRLQRGDGVVLRRKCAVYWLGPSKYPAFIGYPRCWANISTNSEDKRIDNPPDKSGSPSSAEEMLKLELPQLEIRPSQT